MNQSRELVRELEIELERVQRENQDLRRKVEQLQMRINGER